MKLIPALRDTAALACLAATVLAAPDSALAAQRAFFIFQSPSAETVPGGMATNFAVTLTYSNASGTINNAVFTNGVSVMPAGQGVTVGLSSVTAPIADGGGTGTSTGRTRDGSISKASVVPARVRRLERAQ